MKNKNQISRRDFILKSTMSAAGLFMGNSMSNLFNNNASFLDDLTAQGIATSSDPISNTESSSFGFISLDGSYFLPIRYSEKKAAAGDDSPEESSALMALIEKTSKSDSVWTHQPSNINKNDPFQNNKYLGKDKFFRMDYSKGIAKITIEWDIIQPIRWARTKPDVYNVLVNYRALVLKAGGTWDDSSIESIWLNSIPEKNGCIMGLQSKFTMPSTDKKKATISRYLAIEHDYLKREITLTAPERFDSTDKIWNESILQMRFGKKYLD
jgi:hypothetical protein